MFKVNSLEGCEIIQFIMNYNQWPKQIRQQWVKNKQVFLKWPGSGESRNFIFSAIRSEVERRVTFYIF